MKILVTGGAGYLGSILVPALLHEGHEVTVIDTMMYNQSSLLDCVSDTRLVIVRGDARDEKLIKKYLTDKDFIIPLACFVGAPLCDKYPSEARSINTGAIKLILKLRTHKQKIIYPNTNSGYGIGQNSEFCTEETPLNPISLYGITKVEAERALLEAGNTIILRLATVFGASPRMRLDLLVNDFVYRAVVDRFIILFEADFKRNYIHIRDVARAFLFMMTHFDRLKNNVYNLGLSDTNISKKELCEAIQKQVPDFYFMEAKIGQDPDKRNYIVSNEKVEKAGFKPKYSLDDGIAELIRTYQVIRRSQFSNI